MRYIKVLLLGVFFFLGLVFFFQNQTPLSQQMELTLNLFFVPPITSISLPFYFLLVIAFACGCLLSWFLLLWDKFSTSAKLVKSKWTIKSQQNEIERLHKKFDEVFGEKKPASLTALPSDTSKADAETKKK